MTSVATSVRRDSLVIGLIGGQVSARLGGQTQNSPAPVTTEASLSPESAGPVNAAMLTEPFETLDIAPLTAIDDMTPRMVQVSARSGR